MGKVHKKPCRGAGQTELVPHSAKTGPLTVTCLVVKYLNKKKVKLETTGAIARFTSEPEDKQTLKLM